MIFNVSEGESGITATMQTKVRDSRKPKTLRVPQGLRRSSRLWFDLCGDVRLEKSVSALYTNPRPRIGRTGEDRDTDAEIETGREAPGYREMEEASM